MTLPTAKAEFFKTLAHPVRIRILETLGAGDRSVAELQAELNLGQSNASQHLGVLRRAGLVTGNRHGSSVRYAIADPRITELLSTARAMLVDTAVGTQRELETT